jgi:CheY-like chemotaxis protein
MMTGETLQGRSILVVDDDSDAVELFATSFQKLGAEVRTARGVEIALALLAARRPDVVLCDLHLPGLDGYSLLEGMRSDPSLCDVPVIAISGSHPSIERERSLAAGFAQHLTKPMKLREIVSALVAVIESRHAA